MSESSYTQILSEAAKLPPDEQLLLIEQLADRLRRVRTQPCQRLRWEDCAGIGAEIRSEEDAQEWVSRTRAESDEARRVR